MECLYNAVHHSAILDLAWQWQAKYIDQIMNSQKKFVCSFVCILVKKGDGVL